MSAPATKPIADMSKDELVAAHQKLTERLRIDAEQDEAQWAKWQAEHDATRNFDDSQASSGNEEARGAEEEWEKPIPFDDFDLPLFPVAALPPWHRRFVEAEAIATQTPEDLSAMMTLTACAAALSRKVVVRAWDGWEEPVNIYSVVSYQSGGRKSTVVRRAAQPLADAEEALQERMADAVSRAAQTRKIREKSLADLESRAAKASGQERNKLCLEAEQLARELDAEKVLVSPTLLVDDITPEDLVRQLELHDERLAVMTAEAGPFKDMGGKYSKEPNFEIWLKGHCGDDFRANRVGRKSVRLKHPAITLGIAVQPDVIRGLAATPGFRGRGMLGRFAYSMPRSMVGTREVRSTPTPEPIQAAYNKQVRVYAEWEPGRNEDGSLRPVVMVLTADAAATLEAFAKQLEPKLAETGELGQMSDWGGKLCGLILRIAGIFSINSHFSNSSLSLSVSREDVSNAILIGEYLTEHAKAAFACMGTDDNLEAAKHLLRWMQAKGWTDFTTTKLHQEVRGDQRFKEAASLERPLAILEERRFIRPETQAPRDGGKAGRSPSKKYRVNPFNPKNP